MGSCRRAREDRRVRRSDAVGQPRLPRAGRSHPADLPDHGGPLGDPGARVSVGFDRKRLLHGEQEYIFHTDLPHAGDTLTAREKVVDRFSKPGKRGGTMRFATVVTEYRSSDGTLVAEARATFIETAPR